jgi:chromosomal replication initiation ATPase DnaA
MEKICEVNQLGLERLMSKARGNIYRSLTISLIKKLTPLKLTEIGELFDLDYSAVSQVAKRFAQKGKKDKEIERRKERVIESLK